MQEDWMEDRAAPLAEPGPYGEAFGQAQPMGEAPPPPVGTGQAQGAGGMPPGEGMPPNDGTLPNEGAPPGGEAPLHEGTPPGAGTLFDALARYHAREADERMLADPRQGPIYRELRGEVLELLDYCRATGRGEIGLEDAYNVVLKNNLPRLLEQASGAAQSRAVRSISAAAAASPGPLGAGSPPKALDFASMSDADFEKYEQMALRGQLSKN